MVDDVAVLYLSVFCLCYVLLLLHNMYVTDVRTFYTQTNEEFMKCVINYTIGLLAFSGIISNPGKLKNTHFSRSGE